MRAHSAAAIAAISVVSIAQAGEWPFDRDGRAILEIKGARFLMPADAPSRFGVTFALKHEPAGKTSSLTLKQVLEKPDDARAEFSRASSVRVDIPNRPDRTERWLGRFGHNEVKLNAVSIEAGEGVAEDCVAEAKRLNVFRVKLKNGEEKTGEGGWAEFKSDRAPRNYAYIKAPRANTLPDHFDSIQCDYHRNCHATACMHPSVAFTYRFDRGLHPRVEWEAIVARAGEVMRYLVPAVPR